MIAKSGEEARQGRTFSSAAIASMAMSCARSASVSYFREHAPEFEVIETLVNLEASQVDP